MDKKTWYIIGGIGALLGGYLFFVYKQGLKLMDMTYSFKNFKIAQGSGLQSFNVTMDLVLNNPSNVDFKINDYRIDVEVQGTYVTTLVGRNLNITIPKSQSVSIPLALQFDPRTLGANLLSLFVDVFLAGNNNATKNFGIRYKGEVSGRIGLLGFRNVPVDYTYMVNE
jgi:hypothetical protein